MRPSRKGMWAMVAGSIILFASVVVGVWPQKFDDQGWISAFLMLLAMLLVGVGVHIFWNLSNEHGPEWPEDDIIHDEDVICVIGHETPNEALNFKRQK